MQELPPLECRPIQEGSSLLIRGFPSGAKPYEEVLTFLRKGTMLQKYGRHGKPKYHYFRLGAEDSQLQWESKNGRIRNVPLLRMRHFQRGQETDVFRRRPQPLRAFLSFSILYLDEKKNERSLDVICLDHGDFEMWYWGIQVVRSYPPSQFYAIMAQRSIVEEPKKPFNAPLIKVDVSRSLDATTPSTNLSATSSVNTIATNVTVSPVLNSSFTPPPTSARSNQAAGASCAGSTTTTATTLHKNGGGPSSISRSQRKAGEGDASAKGTAVVKGTAPWWDFASGIATSGGLIGKREIGDLYVWGSLAQAELTDTHTSGLGQHPDPGCCVSNDPMLEWQQTPIPELVHDTGSVDVVLAACSTRHAALVSRAGELYTWGYGKDGNLGHGSVSSLASPRRVLGGWVPKGEGVRALSCSDGCTAAVTSEGSLYTWGRGLSGQLGHGDCYPCAIPKRVMLGSLHGRPLVRVVRVSVGPTHTAAITADGRLYTWGDGQFGQLGHGTTNPEFHPRQVQALEGCFITDVACGWWHTAAIAYRCGDAGVGQHGALADSNAHGACGEDLVVQDLGRGAAEPQDQHQVDQGAAGLQLQQQQQQTQVEHAQQWQCEQLLEQQQQQPQHPYERLHQQLQLHLCQAYGLVQDSRPVDFPQPSSPPLPSTFRSPAVIKTVPAVTSKAEEGLDGGMGLRAECSMTSPAAPSRQEAYLEEEGPQSSSTSATLPRKRSVSFLDGVYGLSQQRRQSHRESVSPSGGSASSQRAGHLSRESPRSPSKLSSAKPFNLQLELQQHPHLQLQQQQHPKPPRSGGGRKIGDSAGSIEGQGGDSSGMAGAAADRGVTGQTRQQGMDGKGAEGHQDVCGGQQLQQQQQPRHAAVTADELKDGLFSEASPSIVLRIDDMEHPYRSSAPTRASPPLASVVGKQGRLLHDGGMCSLSGSLTKGRGMDQPMLSVPLASHTNHHHYSSSSVFGGGAHTAPGRQHGAGVLYTWGGTYGWVEPKEIREAVAHQQEEQQQQSGRGSMDAPPESCQSLEDEGSCRNSHCLLSTATWTSVPPSPSVPFKHDHHGGCLGTGDKEGRMLPTRVGGELEALEVAQVACGLNLTVAVTRCGKVYQMGGTGAQVEQGKQAPWEGCTSPMPVDSSLKGLFVEQVACGMHHVAAVASFVSPHGKLVEEKRRSRLFTWGRGAAGQLGHELAKDCCIPQAVASVEGRRILHVASGGNHTLAICEHNALDHARRTTQHHFDKCSHQSSMIGSRSTASLTQQLLASVPSCRASSLLHNQSLASSSSHHMHGSPPLSALYNLGAPGGPFSATLPVLHQAQSFGSRAAHQAAIASGALSSLLAQSLGLSSDKPDRASGLSISGSSSEQRLHQSSTMGRLPTGMLHSMGAAAASAVAAVTPFRDSWGGSSIESKRRDKVARDKRSTHTGVVQDGLPGRVVGIPQGVADYSLDHPHSPSRQIGRSARVSRAGDWQGFDSDLSPPISMQHQRLSRLQNQKRALHGGRQSSLRSHSHRNTTSEGFFRDLPSPLLGRKASIQFKQHQQNSSLGAPAASSDGSVTDGAEGLGATTIASTQRLPGRSTSRFGTSSSAQVPDASRELSSHPHEDVDNEPLQVATSVQSAQELQRAFSGSAPQPPKAWSAEVDGFTRTLLSEDLDEYMACHNSRPEQQYSESDSLSGYTASPLTSPLAGLHPPLLIAHPPLPSALTPSRELLHQQQQQQQQGRAAVHDQQGTQGINHQQPSRHHPAAESVLGAALSQQHLHQQQQQGHLPTDSASPVLAHSARSTRSSAGRQHRERAQHTSKLQQGVHDVLAPQGPSQQQGQPAAEMQLGTNRSSSFILSGFPASQLVPSSTLLHASSPSNGASSTQRASSQQHAPSAQDASPSKQLYSAEAFLQLPPQGLLQQQRQQQQQHDLQKQQKQQAQPSSSKFAPNQGLHARHHTRSATLANWAEMPLQNPSNTQQPILPPLHLHSHPPSQESSSHTLQGSTYEPGIHPSCSLPLSAYAKWYDNHAASEGEESGLAEGMSSQTYSAAGNLFSSTNPLSLLPALSGGSNLSRDSSYVRGMRRFGADAGHTPSHSSSGEDGPHGNVACDQEAQQGQSNTVLEQQQLQDPHAPVKNNVSQISQPQLQVHAPVSEQPQHHQHDQLHGQHTAVQRQQHNHDQHGPVYKQASHVSLSPSITDLSSQPHMNVHRYRGTSIDGSASPTSSARSPSQPITSAHSHTFQLSQTLSASISPSKNNTPCSLVAPEIAHHAASTAATLSQSSWTCSTPPRIFDLSSLGATNLTARTRLSPSFERSSSPAVVSDAHCHGLPVQGMPFLLPPPFTTGLDEGCTSPGSTPSPASQPLCIASARRMVGVPCLTGRGVLGGPRAYAHSRSRSLSTTPPPVGDPGSRESSVPPKPHLSYGRESSSGQLSSPRGSFRHRLSLAAGEGESGPLRGATSSVERATSVGKGRSSTESSKGFLKGMGSESLSCRGRASVDGGTCKGGLGSRGRVTEGGERGQENQLGGVGSSRLGISGGLRVKESMKGQQEAPQIQQSNGHYTPQHTQQHTRTPSNTLLGHQGSQHSPPPKPDSSAQCLQLLQQPSSGRSSANSNSSSQLLKGDFSNHPFASAFSLEDPLPAAPQPESAPFSDLPHNHQQQPHQQLGNPLNTNCDPQHCHTLAAFGAGHEQQQHQQHEQLRSSRDGSDHPQHGVPAHSTTHAYPFEAWGAAAAATGSGALAFVPNHATSTQGSGPQGSRSNSVGGGSVVDGTPGDREPWGWARDSRGSTCHAVPSGDLGGMEVEGRMGGMHGAQQLSRRHSDSSDLMLSGHPNHPSYKHMHLHQPRCAPGQHPPPTHNSHTRAAHAYGPAAGGSRGLGHGGVLSAGQPPSAAFDVAGVIQAAGPAMLRTKAGSMLHAAVRAHRHTWSTETQSMDVAGTATLSDASSSLAPPPGQPQHQNEQ